MSSSSSTVKNSNQSLNQSNWEIKLLYDGECPLCLREVNFLQKRDGGRGKVAFVDIAADDYNPEENGGIDFETAMGRIHGILPDGTVIKNVEVFRRVYEALGMGWVYAITKLPILGSLANFIYGIWADLRLKLTGRPSLETVIKERQERLGCDDRGRCRVD
ncbi:MAG: thiol-disulfide oxidoreductase DCC family protein [Rivularia sp. (in: cyanobacteria)]